MSYQLENNDLTARTNHTRKVFVAVVEGANNNLPTPHVAHRIINYINTEYKELHESVPCALSARIGMGFFDAYKDRRTVARMQYAINMAGGYTGSRGVSYPPKGMTYKHIQYKYYAGIMQGLSVSDIEDMATQQYAPTHVSSDYAYDEHELYINKPVCSGSAWEHDMEAPVEWQDVHNEVMNVDGVQIYLEYYDGYKHMMPYVKNIIEAAIYSLDMSNYKKAISFVVPQVMEVCEYEDGKYMMPGGTAQEGAFVDTVTLNPNVADYYEVVEIIGHEFRHVWQFSEGWDCERHLPYMERRIEKDAYHFGGVFRREFKAAVEAQKAAKGN